MMNQITEKGGENHMSRKTIALAGVALAVVLVGVFAAIPALAQEAAPKPDASSCLPGRGGLRGFGGGSWTQYDTMAEALGLTPEELFAQLHAGNSLEEIAEEQGVDLESVQEAMNAARVEAMRENIQKAVEDGTMSQEQADWMLEGMDKGFTPMRGGLNGGMCGGMRGGMRGGMFNRAPAETLSTELSSS